MRYLGLDLGNRTCGIAVSDSLGLVATGIETYRFKEQDLASLLPYIIKVASERSIKDIVLGLPKNMDGTLGFQSEYVLKFKSMLEEQNFNVYLMDERLSTVQVNKIMIEADLSRDKRKQQVDKLAAVVILQSFLDSIKKIGS